MRSRMRKGAALGLGSLLLVAASSSCGGGTPVAHRKTTVSSTTSQPPKTPTTTSASVAVSVALCPIPASDYAGTPDGPQSPPPTLTVASTLAPPSGGALFGTVFPASRTSYLVAPAAARCGADWFNADGGQVTTATSTSDPSEGVTMVLDAGGAGPSTDLACPYIPAVGAADENFRGNSSACGRPSGEVVQAIASGVPNLYAAAVWVPAQVKDSTLGLALSGNGADPTVALFTAQVTPPGGATGQMIACTLAPAEQNICQTSLEFFLATQSAVGTTVGSSNLAQMDASISTLLENN